MIKDKLLAVIGGETKLMNLIIGGLRKAWFRSPNRLAVLNRVRSEEEVFNKDGSLSKRKAVWFKCELCGEKVKGQRSKKASFIQIDHKEPIIPFDKQLESWDELIQRVFVDIDGLQAICSLCHSIKTQEENKLRRTFKRK